MKRKRILLLGVISFLFCTSMVASALTDIESYKYNSSKKITSQMDTNSVLSVSSEHDEEVGLLVSDGEIKLKELNVFKRGSSKATNSDYYGSNAALLVYKGANLVVDSATITTYGVNSIGMYANKNGKIDIKKGTITTNNESSFGIAANEGEVTASDVSVLTEGSGSIAVKGYSGASINIVNGDIKTLKDNSPVVSTASKVVIDDSSLECESSNGIVIENSGDVSLNKSDLYTMNSTSEKPKNIYMYQSSKKDSNITTTFSATSSEIVTEAGEAFNITNTKAVINLKDTKFSNNLIDFLKAEKTTMDGANVTLYLEKQVIEGNIVSDASSFVHINMGDKSRLRGALLGNGKNIELELDESSFIVLTGDSYITRLNNAKKDNSNIYLNNHKLYLNDEEVSGNTGTPPELYEVATNNNDNKNTTKEVIKPSTSITLAVILIVAVLIITIAVIVIISISKNNKNNIYK